MIGGGRVLGLALGLVPAVALAAADEVPYGSMESGLAVHAMATRMDRASFDGAVATYPTAAGGRHAVRIGRYFMWSLVKLFAAPQKVDRIALRGFVETCGLKTTSFSKRVTCHLATTVRVMNGGKTRDISFKTSKNVGAHFEPGGDYAGAVHGEVTMPVDDAVAHIARKLRAMGAR